ncbi:MAG: hypothetical protein ICV59_02135 [Thermoleophilia bacterium]|nr:hypothetical protein [Thermoleophilia bacterium]
MQAMVTTAAQTEATYQAGGALVRTYLRLRDEMLEILGQPGLDQLRNEFNRLFPILEEPPGSLGPSDSVPNQRLAEAAHEAQLSLRRLQGWIQGLIDELTYADRLRAEAEAKAAQAARVQTGFRQP